VQNSRQTLAKLESEVFPDEIYEGKRAGFAVLYGKIKRESSAVFDLVQKRRRVRSNRRVRGFWK